MGVKKFAYNGFIILKIPEPFSSEITRLRLKYDSKTARLPVEIAVLGSSGVGPIKPDNNAGEIIASIKGIVSKISKFEFSFGRIAVFPKSNIYYLEPENRKPFDDIHAGLKNLGLDCFSIKFPFNPHCTISAESILNEVQKNEIFREAFPRQKIVLDKISLIEFNFNPYILNLFYEWELK